MNKKIRLLSFSLTMLLLTLFSSLSFAQESVRRGCVRDEKGQPITGVTVIALQTNKGVTTDAKGNFSITLPVNSTYVLKFTFIGYEETQVKVSPATNNIDVVLKESAVNIQEVVAIGYGSQRKVDITGAVSSVGSEIAENRVVTSVLDALKGQIAGVRISANQGGPSAGMEINIRGNTSLSGNSAPLYIIDGLPGSASDVSPGDIQTIDILKDASSTAIYGARGANGVVLITTKKGKNNQVSVNLYSMIGVQSASKKLDLLDSYEFARQKNFQRFIYSKYSDGIYDNLSAGTDYFIDPEGNLWSKGNTQPQPFDNYEKYAQPGAINTDWQDVMLSQAIMQDHRISVRGGGKDNTFSVMVNYLKNEGILLNTNSETLSGRFNFSQSLGKYVSLRSNASYRRTFNNGISGNIGQMLTIAPTKPEYIASGDDSYLLPGEVGGRDSSPLNQANKVTSKSDSYSFSINQEVNVTVNPNWSGTTIFGYRKSGSTESQYFPSDVPQGWDYNGRAVKNLGESENIFNENMIRYNLESGIHKVGGVVGMSIERNWNRNLGVENRDFALESLAEEGIKMGTIPQTPTSSYVVSSMASFFGRVTYDINDKYLFKATFRADGASNFSKNNKWGYFPSAAAAWRINQEEWMKDITTISNMKLRFSWGQSGKRAIGNFATLANIGTGLYTFDGESLGISSYRSTLPNDNLKWETTEEFNIGYDMGFFRDKLSFSIDAYQRTTRDLLYSVPMATYSGFGQQTQNLGSIRNKGIEVALFADIIRTKNINWSFKFSVAHNHSKLLEIGDRGWEINSIGSGSYYLGEGLQLANWYGYRTSGIWQSQSEIDAAYKSYTDNVASGAGPRPGDISKQTYDKLKPGYRKIVDQPDAQGNYNGTINADDRVILGQGEPSIMGGFATSFRYKLVTVDMGFTFNYGNKIYNQTARGLEVSFDQRNQFKSTVNRWTPTLYHFDASAPDKRGELFMTGSNSNSYEINTWGQTSEGTIYDVFLEDGSYLRMDDLTVAFDMPQRWLSKIGFKSAQLFIAGKNLFVISSYKGYDPEVNMSPNEAKFLCPGLDNNAYPRTRVFSIGLNITF